jgi:hypothetical protein
MIGEKAPVTHDQAHRHFFLGHKLSSSECRILCLSPGREFETINETEYQQHRAPPHIRVQVKEDHARTYRRIYQLVDSRRKDQRTIRGK